MSATVDFGRFRAIVRGGRWRLVSARDRPVAKLAVAYLQSLVPGDSPSIPDRDRWAAEDAVKRLGGRIVACDPPPAFDPDVVY